MAIQFPNFPMLTPEQANPLMYGIKQGMGVVKNYRDLQKAILENQLKSVEAQYAQPMAEQNLLKAKQFNEMYKPDIQSQIGLRGAETRKLNLEAPYIQQEKEALIAAKKISNELDKLKVKYPGLGAGGLVGSLGFASYLADHPEIENKLRRNTNQQENPVNEQVTQATGHSPVGNYGNIGGIDNPRDMLMESAFTDIRYKNALVKSLEKNLTARSFDKLPAAEKSYAIAQARALGKTGEEAVKEFQNGRTLRDMANDAGYKPNDAATWPVARGAPTTAMQTRMQRANTTLAALDFISPILADAYAPYAARFKGASPALIKDMLKNENEDQQAKAFAAYALQPEVSSLRINAQGGNVGIGAIQHMEDSAYTKLNTLGMSPNSKVYQKSIKYLDHWISMMNKAENRALYKQQESEDISESSNNISDEELLNTIVRGQQ